MFEFMPSSSQIWRNNTHLQYVAATDTFFAVCRFRSQSASVNVGEISKSGQA